MASSLTFHRVTRLPLELGRVTAELVVRTEDERNVGCVENRLVMDFIVGREVEWY
jgi:hypothetical protein